jgi:hypothetical protein
MTPGHRTDTPIFRGEHRTQSFGQSHYSILAHIVPGIWSRDQSGDGRRGNNLPSFAMRLDQRTENLNAPNYRHQIDAENPIPTCICPMTVTPAAADPRIVDENMDPAVPRHGGVRCGLEFCFERYIRSHAVNVGVGKFQFLHRRC